MKFTKLSFTSGLLKPRSLNNHGVRENCAMISKMNLNTYFVSSLFAACCSIGWAIMTQSGQMSRFWDTAQHISILLKEIWFLDFLFLFLLFFSYIWVCSYYYAMQNFSIQSCLLLNNQARLSKSLTRFPCSVGLFRKSLFQANLFQFTWHTASVKLMKNFKAIPDV